MPQAVSMPDSALPPAMPTPSARRRRVLLGAYAVSPARGSEPGLGWNLCRALAAHHDVTVLCATGTPGADEQVHRREIEAWMDVHGPIPGLRIHYVPHPPWSWLCQREREMFRWTVYYSGYAAWQRAAYRHALALHQEQQFELVHHLNILGFREPGYLWKLPVPFVWGPIAGAANIPWPFFSMLRPRNRLAYGVRNLANQFQKHAARRPRAAARKASRIWVIGEENRQMVQDLWSRPSQSLLESGATPRPGIMPKRRAPGQPLRVIWSGLHIGRKALPILLGALQQLFPRFGPEQLDVTILGAGPETERWKRLAGALGLNSRLRWTGKLPHARALEELSRGDVLACTSLLEATSLVVTEALSLALPVICHDACGMAVAVTPDSGMKIPLRDPRTSIAGFVEAIGRLIEQPGEVERLSAGALRRAGELQWTDIAAELSRGYDEVLSDRVEAES